MAVAFANLPLPSLHDIVYNKTGEFFISRTHE